MLELVTGVLIVFAAIVVLRRLVGIRRGRWGTTVAAVLVGNAAAAGVLRAIYGNVRDVPELALLAAWALVTIFAEMGVLVIELLSRHGISRRAAHLPHPIRGTRALAARMARYIEVGVIAEGSCIRVSTPTSPVRDSGDR
jgi:ubiquinone biosynthesis protein